MTGHVWVSAIEGPSPRARGKQHHAGHAFGRDGTIPAGAGETDLERPVGQRGGDHPRGRGGNNYADAMRTGAKGPSPRARGKPPRARVH